MEKRITLTGKILIIIDQEDLLDLLVQICNQLMPQLTVLTAQSGKQGIESAHKERPDVILLDTRMPDMNGYNACQWLRVHEDTKHIPIIMFTGIKVDSYGRAKAWESGADAFLSKPIDHVEMVAQVNAMLRMKKAEDQLRKDKETLKEKDLLLKEIHHRVKNNMAMVSSLLNVQSSYIKDKKARTALAESRTCINSIAMLHEKLYRSSDLVNIDFHDYIHDLANSLIISYSIPRDKIELIIDINDIYLGADAAIPLGLIITELVTNSLKYGIKNDEKLTITIRMKLEDNHFHLTVGDSGPGIDENLDWENTETLGIRLVTLLTEQLTGKIHLDRQNGTTFHITFSNEGKNKNKKLN
jgi:two-component sensor histidine kinase/CheY-like chemotaxis protein